MKSAWSGVPVEIAGAMALAESLYHALGHGPLWAQTAIVLAEHREATGDAKGALEPLLARIAAADVVTLGSGLSRHGEAAELARRVARETERRLVIDADGLNAFEGHGERLRELRVERVLTPHLGEMHRLCGIEPAALEARRIDAAREWAERWGSVLVLKGAPTVTVSAKGIATVNPTGNPGMATAGTGDVLTGTIAALLAQGLSCYDAARLGVYVHGMAGDIAAGEKGQLGLTASDLLDYTNRSGTIAFAVACRIARSPAGANATAREISTGRGSIDAKTARAIARAVPNQAPAAAL